MSENPDPNGQQNMEALNTVQDQLPDGHPDVQHTVPVELRKKPLFPNHENDANAVVHIANQTKLIQGLKGEVAEVTEKLEEADLNAVTGLPGRKSFYKEIAKYTGRANIGEPQTFGLAFGDADFLKAHNDWPGGKLHEAGDDYLRAIANAWDTSRRPGDELFHLSGDEFVAILPKLDKVSESDGSDAHQRAQYELELTNALNKKVNGALNDDKSLTPDLPRHISIGVVIHEGQETVEDMLYLAEVALREQKEDFKRGIDPTLRAQIQANDDRLQIPPDLTMPTHPPEV